MTSNSTCVWIKGKIASVCFGNDKAAQREKGSHRSSARNNDDSRASCTPWLRGESERAQKLLPVAGLVRMYELKR